MKGSSEIEVAVDGYIVNKTFIMSFPVSFINTGKTAFYGFSVQIHERMLVVKDGENTIGHMKRQIKIIIMDKNIKIAVAGTGYV